MIYDLVKGTEWEKLTAYLSPSFFDVVPFLGMTRQVGALVHKATERTAFEQVRRQHWKHHSGITGGSPTPFPVALVEIFFAELHLFPETILDLRANTFAAAAWTPTPIWTRWDTGFIHSLRNLYKGFYTDDAALFESALAALDLLHAKDIFIQHFGGQNQRGVEFKLADYKETFHQVFLSCKKHGARLHPNFLPLGVLLGTLYEHMEAKQAGPVDVRSAYERFATSTAAT